MLDSGERVRILETVLDVAVVPDWFAEILPCGGNGYPIIDPTTNFLSQCILSTIEAAFSAFFVIPIVVVAYNLSTHQRGSTTSYHSQIALLFAGLTPVLRLTDHFIQDSTPTYTEWLTIVVSGLAAVLVHVEDGRVRVTTAESLLYWLCASLTTLGLMVDATIKAKSFQLLPALLFVSNTATFVSEILNTRDQKQSNFETSNVFDRISLSYLTPMLKTGAKGNILKEDIPEAPLGITALNTYEKLKVELSYFSTSNNYRVLLAVANLARGRISLLLLLTVANDLFTFLRPVCLSYFLLYLQKYASGTANIFPVIYLGFLYILLPLGAVAFENMSTLTSTSIYVTTRSSLTGLIYRKALALSPKSREEFDSAKVMNLLNVDTNQINSVATYLSMLISAPISLVIAAWQLWLFIGKTMFASIPVYLMFIPISAFFTHFLFNLYPESLKYRDERNKATSDAFRNIKSLKLYAWEMPFYNRVANIRSEKELPTQRVILALNAIISSVWSSLSEYVLCAIFVYFLWVGQGTLTPEVVFPCFGLLSYITTPFMVLPQALSSLGKALASQKRINELLLAEEQTFQNYYRLPASVGFTDESVNCTDAVISWTGEDIENKIALRNVSLSATNGDLVCIIGRVGSGKSGLLKALVNELRVLSGTITLKGNIAYCPQEPWLQNRTFKENILFGKTFDEEFYNITIEACSLSTDIKNLPQGDETDVGERGISLSGGQKARVALARAIYSRADVYVLDDVLSAVDEHVANHLIEKVFSKDGILSSKTIILASNNIKVLSHASKLIALQDKGIAESVSFSEAIKLKDESPTYRLIKEFGGDTNFDGITLVERKSHISNANASAWEHTRPASVDISPSTLFKGLEEESTTVGTVSLGIYKRYFENENFYVLLSGILFVLVSVLFTNSLSVWLGYLSDHSLSNLSDGWFYITIYALLSTLSSITYFFGIIGMTGWIGLRIAKTLQNAMLYNTMRAPMQFFERTPLGTLINRFSDDVTKLDFELPMVIHNCLRSSLNITVAAMIVIAGAPVVILVLVPLVFLLNYYRRIFVPGSRRISRMAAASNSPVLSHIEETVRGAALIRSYDRVDQFIELHEHRTDYWMQLRLISQSVNGWLQWRLQSATAVLELCSITFIITATHFGWLSAGIAGMVLYNSARVGMMSRFIITSWSSLEVSGVALERILEYVDSETEAPTHIPETAPKPSWPENGIVNFKDFSTRYGKDSKDVLHKLSFSIGSQEKIGIVGRTGSGKSTLTLALFRIIEASNGNISIDGIDTSTIGLTDLRSKLSIIPQDAQILAGTLRENLDPLDRVDDARLWQVLEICHLKKHFEELGSGLDTKLSEGGDNLSRGQAQLICLGRALLHDSRILVLDEATASVDVETDKVVQTTIRSEFKDRTIITIAHRLHTIADSDRIIALDQGKIIEFDTPENLLNAKGAFWRLSNAGKSDILNE